MKIWKDVIEPTSTEYLWYKLNKFGGFVGWFKYSNGKWKLVKEEDINPSESDSGGPLPENVVTTNQLETALAGKVDTVSGKGLSTNDYDNTEKGKVDSAYQKPVGGIPASDLASGVIPDVSGKENTSNKVTSLSSASTDTQYPSAKATYDAINPSVQSSQPAGGMLPNVLYNLGTLTGNVTFALSSSIDNNIANHYYWTFDTGNTAPTITWPSGITWYSGSAPTINTDKHYEISVLNGIGVYMEV